MRPSHATARPPRALAPPRRAHGPCRARILALGRIHGRTVWGGCTGGGLVCVSLTIHTHQAMGHKRGVQFGLPRSAVHPPQQVSGTLTARLTEDQDRGAGQVLRRDVLLRVSSAQEPRRGPFRSLASSNPVSNFISVANFCLRRIPALPPTVGRQSHDSCLPLCAGGILTIPPVHPVRPASSLAAAGAPRRLLRLVGPPHARIAPLCLPAAGPRASP